MEDTDDKKCAPGGARTPDPGLIRPMLYQLSYQSCDGGGRICTVAVDARRRTRAIGPSRGSGGWMAERSKAPVSGTGLFGGVGSNPTPITIFFFVGPRAAAFSLVLLVGGKQQVGRGCTKKKKLPRLGIAPRLPRPQRGVLLLYYLGDHTTPRFARNQQS